MLVFSIGSKLRSRLLHQLLIAVKLFIQLKLKEKPEGKGGCIRLLQGVLLLNILNQRFFEIKNSNNLMFIYRLLYSANIRMGYLTPVKTSLPTHTCATYHR
ncbi:MAG: hypothetical protein COC06_05295 [Bacteroidales bacterium]|nr:MAG: hypothetical protein COC06_05295 [Bacteroidales bacterium]